MNSKPCPALKALFNEGGIAIGNSNKGKFTGLSNFSTNTISKLPNINKKYGLQLLFIQSRILSLSQSIFYFVDYCITNTTLIPKELGRHVKST